MFKDRFTAILTFFCALLATALSVPAQCSNDVFFKPAAGKVINGEVLLSTTKEHYVDFTNDGKVDLLGFKRDADQTYRTILILPSDGAGAFGTPIEVPIITTFEPPNFGNFQVGDFNLDGEMDFIIRLNTNPSSVLVYLNNPNGNSFSALTPFALPTNESIINIADVNADGRADIITSIAGSSGTNYYYRARNMDGTFGINIQLMGTQLSGSYSFAADFTGDGKVDFPYIGGTSGNYSLQILVNQGNGTFALSPSSISLGSRANVLGIKDFNNDGRPDIAVGSPISILLNQGSGVFTKTDYSLQVSLSNFADLNGDGATDILLTYFSGYATLINNGAGVFTPRSYNRDFKGYLIGDLNGDNKADAVTFGAYRYFAGYDPKVFRDSSLRVNLNTCSIYGQPEIVDFDGDGKTDLNFYLPSAGRYRYQFSTGGASSFTVGQSGDIGIPGDFDGDGKTDQAVYRPSNGGWYVFNSSNNTTSVVLYGASEDKPVAADYDGDGRTDYAVFRPSTGAWYVLSTGTSQMFGLSFGASEDRPVPGDYDGDGKANIAVFRPSTGAWYILRPDFSFYGLPYGLGTDVNVPADYDGDGKTDIAVFRSGAQSYWYILRSSDNQSASLPYGTTNDTPQPGDYNGDGVSDLAVYRSTGVWYSSVTLAPYANFAAQAGEIPLSTLDKSY